jgi:hypothetical protein
MQTLSLHPNQKSATKEQKPVHETYLNFDTLRGMVRFILFANRQGAVRASLG